jgi:hypothetical protein
MPDAGSMMESALRLCSLAVVAVTSQLLEKVAPVRPHERCHHRHVQNHQQQQQQQQFHCQRWSSVDGITGEKTLAVTGLSSGPHCPHEREHSGSYSSQAGALPSGRRVVRLEIRTITPASNSNCKGNSTCTAHNSAAGSNRTEDDLNISPSVSISSSKGEGISTNAGNNKGEQSDLVATSSQHVQLLVSGASTRRCVGRKISCQLRDYLRAAGIKLYGSGPPVTRRLYTIWEEDDEEGDPRPLIVAQKKLTPANSFRRKKADLAGTISGIMSRDSSRGHRCRA